MTGGAARRVRIALGGRSAVRSILIGNGTLDIRRPKGIICAMAARAIYFSQLQLMGKRRAGQVAMTIHAAQLSVLGFGETVNIYAESGALFVGRGMAH
jgi:hypothetical protein